MKKVLFFFLAVISITFSNAQTILIKDSTYDPNDAPFGATHVTTYTYDSACRLASQTSTLPPSLNSYTYYANGNLYQNLQQIYNGSNTDGSYNWINNGLSTYTYNADGKVISRINQSWNRTLETFLNSDKDTNVYDQKNNLIKNFSQQWIDSLHLWTTQFTNFFYYNINGQIDSTISVEATFGKTTKTYFTYYNSGKQFQIATYDYLDSLGMSLSSSNITTHYYDSTNYINKDSVVSEPSNQPDSLLWREIDVSMTYYDHATNNKIEVDGFTIASNIPEQSNTKTYYFYSRCSSVYPLTLINFLGEQQNSSVLLRWQTANEVNISSFLIERSTDDEHFIKIDSVTSLGSSTNINSYSYLNDNALLMNVTKLYYRLIEVDKNGTNTYSKVVVLNTSANKPSIYVSPNPIVDIVKLYATTIINNALITITDMQGKVLYSASQDIKAGNNVTINASRFAKGMYIITIQLATTKQQLKIIK